MMYLMSGIESHPDFGFGITGESYYKSAEFLYETHYEHYESTQQREAPQNYLYRHSIELFLKSLIIIFHKKLQINYNRDSYRSSRPKILIGGNWRNLYSCHWIDSLYDYWLRELLLPNINKLNQIAPQGDWREVNEISDLFPIICKYDRDSSYFRYPVTGDASLDQHKFTMKRFEADTLENLMENLRSEDEEERGNWGNSIFVNVDEDGNITYAFREDKKPLNSVTDALKKVAHYLSCIHIMSRVTLCGGM